MLTLEPARFSACQASVYLGSTVSSGQKAGTTSRCGAAPGGSAPTVLSQVFTVILAVAIWPPGVPHDATTTIVCRPGEDTCRSASHSPQSAVSCVVGCGPPPSS